MPLIQARIDDLDLDLQNPRYNGLSGMREAVKSIVLDQGKKLVNLAEDIATEGISPIHRLLALRSPDAPRRYVVLDGNRRVAALKILANPSLLDALEDIPHSLSKPLQQLAKEFDRSTVEPLDIFVVDSREEGRRWIELNHTGENEGRGVVSWDGFATARFRGSAPSLNVLALVERHGNLTAKEQELLQGFPVTNLDRLLGTPEVREKLGLELDSGVLQSHYDAGHIHELVKGLKKVVLDLATRRVRVSHLKSKQDRLNYISSFGPSELPNPRKRSEDTTSLQALATYNSSANTERRRTKTKKGASTARNKLIPSTCRLVISDPKIREIFEELHSLPLERYPNAISVLVRVFIELSMDHFGELNVSNWNIDDKLGKKIVKVAEILEGTGIRKTDLASFKRIASVEASPFHVDRLHKFVHSRRAMPTSTELRKGWDEVQFVFEAIWK
jgi:hypothetical protein